MLWRRASGVHLKPQNRAAHRKVNDVRLRNKAPFTSGAGHREVNGSSPPRLGASEAVMASWRSCLKTESEQDQADGAQHAGRFNAAAAAVGEQFFYAPVQNVKDLSAASGEAGYRAGGGDYAGALSILPEIGGRAVLAFLDAGAPGAGKALGPLARFGAGRFGSLATGCRSLLSQLGGRAGQAGHFAPFAGGGRGMTPDQQALKELVDGASLGGRKSLPVDDAETILDWADEVNYPGRRAKPGDVADPSNWDANPVPHIHIPGAGRGGHVLVESGVRPR